MECDPREVDWLLREKYNGEKSFAFFADCKRLENGEPLAYLIGSIPFLQTRIYLDSHPLIPRTETEYWVATQLSMIPIDSPAHILDLCAGSGCIGVALLHARPNSTVDFVELDKQHHATIMKNVIANEINPSRARVFGGNLFDSLEDQYDFIFSNPPYIDHHLGRVADNVLAHEPHLALFGGNKGLEIIARILGSAPSYLTETGTLILEHEPEQTEGIHALAQQRHLSAKTHQDQYQKNRYTIFTRTKS